MRLLRQLLKACGIITAALFLSAIAFTQHTCPIPKCTGQNIDAWLLPAALAPLGIPALIWSTIIVLNAIRRP